MNQEPKQDANEVVGLREAILRLASAQNQVAEAMLAIYQLTKAQGLVLDLLVSEKHIPMGDAGGMVTTLVPEITTPVPEQDVTLDDATTEKPGLVRLIMAAGAGEKEAIHLYNEVARDAKQNDVSPTQKESGDTGAADNFRAQMTFESPPLGGPKPIGFGDNALDSAVEKVSVHYEEEMGARRTEVAKRLAEGTIPVEDTVPMPEEMPHPQPDPAAKSFNYVARQLRPMLQELLSHHVIENGKGNVAMKHYNADIMKVSQDHCFRWPSGFYRSDVDNTVQLFLNIKENNRTVLLILPSLYSAGKYQQLYVTEMQPATILWRDDGGVIRVINDETQITIRETLMPSFENLFRTYLENLK